MVGEEHKKAPEGAFFVAFFLRYIVAWLSLHWSLFSGQKIPGEVPFLNVILF